MRAVRIALSVGRPSRLKKPPGIFPAAYIRSSTSTVSGKKSAPSRASMRPWAVASTIVSPDRTTTAPSACLASFPVSNVISCPPISTETEVGPATVLLINPPLFVEGGGLSQLFGSCPVPGTGRGRKGSLKLPPSAYGWGLSPQTQLLDQSPVTLEILGLRAQMLRQLVDASRQERDLHLRGAGVGFGAPMLTDDLLFGFLAEGQRTSFTRIRSSR